MLPCDHVLPDSQALAAWTPRQARRPSTTWRASSTRQCSQGCREAHTTTPLQVCSQAGSQLPAPEGAGKGVLAGLWPPVAAQEVPAALQGSEPGDTVAKGSWLIQHCPRSDQTVLSYVLAHGNATSLARGKEESVH